MQHIFFLKNYDGPNCLNLFPILVWEGNQSPSGRVECDTEVNNLATLKIKCKISNDHINCVFLDNYDKIEIL